MACNTYIFSCVPDAQSPCNSSPCEHSGTCLYEQCVMACQCQSYRNGDLCESMFVTASQLHQPCVNISKLATVRFRPPHVTVRCICELLKWCHDIDIRDCARQSIFLNIATIHVFQLTSMSVPARPAWMTAHVLMTSMATIVHVQQHIREFIVKVKPNHILHKTN